MTPLPPPPLRQSCYGQLRERACRWGLENGQPQGQFLTHPSSAVVNVSAVVSAPRPVSVFTPAALKEPFVECQGKRVKGLLQQHLPPPPPPSITHYRERPCPFSNTEQAWFSLQCLRSKCQPSCAVGNVSCAEIRPTKKPKRHFHFLSPSSGMWTLSAGLLKKHIPLPQQKKTTTTHFFCLEQFVALIYYCP